MRASTVVRRVLRFSIAAVALATSALAQTTWYVDAGAPPPGSGTLASPYSDLQYALAQATTVSGDTLLVAPGTYFGGFDFLGKDVLVQSTAGAATTILDGQGSWPPIHPTQPDPSPVQSVVRFHNGEGPGAVLDGFTIQHGRGTGTMLAGEGGGVLVEGASPTLRNLAVQQNRAAYGGGMRFVNSASVVSDCSISFNTVACEGACSTFGVGLHTTSAITVERCTFVGNGGYPTQQGGGAWASAGTFIDCTFVSNTAPFGGGAYAQGSAQFHGCIFRLNSANSLEGPYGQGAGVFGGTLFNCTIEDNSFCWKGGGAAAATLIDCVIQRNTVAASLTTSMAFGGGGTFACTLLRCVVRDNRALGVTFVTSGAGCTGGGVLNGSATDCDIHHNEVVSGGGSSFGGLGGAGAALATLVGCTVHENTLYPLFPSTPTVGGGGVYGGTATRCRIWANSAPHGAGAANAALVNCALDANFASVSGGALAVLYGASSASARNCILWGDSLPETAVISGSLTIEWSNVDGGFPGTGNINNEPLFQSAPNHDYHLLAGSPCIDSGDPAQFDPDGSRIDMGVFPFACEAHSYCVGKVNSLGCIPTAGFTGTAMFSGPDDFHVTGSNISKNALGMLLWSRSSNNAPFFNGTLCVGQPFFRAGIQNSGGTGVGPNCTGTTTSTSRTRT